MQFVNFEALGWSSGETEDLSNDCTIIGSHHSPSRPTERRKRGLQNESEAQDGARAASSTSLTTISSPEPFYDIGRIQASYRDAHRSGFLRCSRVPDLFRPTCGSWDPYSLPSRKDIIKVLLDDDAAKKVQREVRDILSSVPKRGEWETTVKSRELTPSDLNEIIRISVGDIQSTDTQSPMSDPSVAGIISKFHEHAESLQRKSGMYRHAGRITSFIEYSLMRVQEVMDGNGRQASTKVGIIYSNSHTGKPTVVGQQIDERESKGG